VQNSDYWHRKREGNVARDIRNLKALRRAGWQVLVVWECQTRDVTRLARRVEAFLRG
jgi:DNA mismatch endonuclease (patch repair protein)